MANSDTPSRPPIDAKEPAEGARDTVERELARQDLRSGKDANQGPDDAADPSADPAWAKHVDKYFNAPAIENEAVQKASHEMKDGREP